MRYWPGTGRMGELQLTGFGEWELENAGLYTGSGTVSSTHKSPFILLDKGPNLRVGWALFDPVHGSLELQDSAGIYSEAGYSLPCKGKGFAILQEGHGRLHWLDQASGEQRLIVDLQELHPGAAIPGAQSL